MAAEEEASDGGEAAIRAGLFARSGDLLTTEGLRDRTVLLVGAGSVGSVAAETLTRAGLGKLIVIDHDVVSAENLSRCVYEAQDVGSAKTLALTRCLSQINPAVSVTQYPQRVEDFGVPELIAVLGECDVALIATDDNDTQARMNLLTYAHGLPAVFPGLYDGALGGEIAVVVPELTACHRCVVADRPSAPDRPTSASQTVDYSTGRLEGVVALAPDIHHVTGVAAKIVLSLLALASGDRAGDFIAGPLSSGLTYALFSMSPDYWIFPRVFGDTPAQYAYQSLWVRPVRHPECSICGAPSHRGPIPDDALQSLTADDIRRAIESADKE